MCHVHDIVNVAMTAIVGHAYDSTLERDVAEVLAQLLSGTFGLRADDS